MTAFLGNLGSPPLLFFFLGVMAVVVRSDLEIPAQVAKALSLYLLFAIGFKGGVALAESSVDAGMLLTLLAAVGLSACIPIYTFFLMKKKLSTADAAAIAATYGSVSAVTFVTAAGYLDIQGVAWSGYLVAAMALMESPAIIVGILLYNHFGKRGQASANLFSWKQLLNESLFNGSVFLILGSMLIGWITGSAGMSQVEPLVKDLFLGLLCLFLLDMGIVAARRFRDSRHAGDALAAGQPLRLVVVAALLMPLANAMLALVVAGFLGLGEGNALLFVVLVASGSYIAVPAAMRLALPEANPGTYLTMSLAITFPFNLLIGIPTYHAMIRWLL
ncbi:MAG: sodium-dependent bicarbonate transport family permease [Halioglobus sp.]|nr:sodium-dependent bicarbonate transport family permease [Halioglobus sp.]